MFKFILISKSSVYLITLIVILFQNVNANGEKSSCHLYGHSCLGAHGKRSNELSQSIDSKLVPTDMDKFIYQTPSLEDELKNQIYSRLINIIKKTNYPLNDNPTLIPQFNRFDDLTRNLFKSKRFDLQGNQFKTYFKKSNDFVNKKTKDLDDYSDIDI